MGVARVPRGKIARPAPAKVTAPEITRYFPRKRLFRLLDSARKRPVVWVSAPPGSGKTTLVGSYIEARRLPRLWYQVDEGDADAHLDNIRGIPFLADNIVMARKRRRVTVYSILSVITTIRKHLFNSAVWPDFTVIPHPDDAILKLAKLKEGRPVREGEYRVTPYRVSHTVPSVGYLVEDKKGHRLFYTGDTGPTNGTWEKIGKRKIHCLVIDVSFPNSMEELAIRTGHLTPRLLRAELDKMVLPPGRVLITHPKPRYRKTIEAEIRKMKIDGMRLLRDGETISV